MTGTLLAVPWVVGVTVAAVGMALDPQPLSPRRLATKWARRGIETMGAAFLGVYDPSLWSTFGIAMQMISAEGVL